MVNAPAAPAAAAPSAVAPSAVAVLWLSSSSGADDFTPLLIYVVIKARTPHLASNLTYIERYRYHPKLTAEVQYYYIQLVS